MEVPKWDERAEGLEMDERCLAVLHAARIGDTVAVTRITNNITFLFTYTGLRPSRAGMENLMNVLRSQPMGPEGSFDHLVGIEEADDYDPVVGKVVNQEKAEAAYHRWRSEKRP